MRLFYIRIDTKIAVSIEQAQRFSYFYNIYSASIMVLNAASNASFMAFASFEVAAVVV